MTMRNAMPLAVCAAVAVIVSAATVGVAGQQNAEPYTAPDHPVGRPRPAGRLEQQHRRAAAAPPTRWPTRETLSDEEVAQRRQASSDLLFSEREGDTGFYNEFWFEYGLDSKPHSR